jgi:hypothetical protein
LGTSSPGTPATALSSPNSNRMPPVTSSGRSTGGSAPAAVPSM